jgi:predicted GIY-YIG superfamily endonuclease
MLKLGTQTGSLTNHLYSRQTIGQPEPAVGMGATILGWTDRHAATIMVIWTERGSRYIGVRQDIATRVDKNGMSESQEYTYQPNPDGHEQIFRQEKTGGWQAVSFNAETKRYRKVEGSGLRIGERDEYYDYSF